MGAKETLEDTVKEPSFEDFESLVFQKRYLYPITAELLEWGKAENTHEYQHHVAGIKKLWKKYHRPNAIECMIGFASYLVETLDAIDSKIPFDFRKANDFGIRYPELKRVGENQVKLKIFTPTIDRYDYENPPSVESLKDFLVFHFENAEEACGDYIMKFYDVTPYLKKSSDPKNGCKTFSEAIAKGQKIYAFIGPVIHKWKTDENGDIVHEQPGDSGEIKMNLTPELIFWSVLCAPYTRIEFGGHGDVYQERMNLKFISDTEVLDVAEYYNSKLKRLLHKNDRKSREKRSKYRDKVNVDDSKLPVYYGIYFDEILKIRELIKPGEGQAVFLNTNEMFHPYDLLDVYSADFLKSKAADDEEAYDEDELLEDCLLASKEFAKVIRSSSKIDEHTKMLYGIDQNAPIEAADYNEIFKFVNEKITKTFSKDIHDKIPHSYIGSMLKHKEFMFIKFAIYTEKKNAEGIRGFKILHPELKKRMDEHLNSLTDYM